MSVVPPPKDRFAFLDVARAAATLLVLFEHAVGRYVPGYDEWSKANGSLGRMGVILFLLVSGFIIPVSLEKSGSNGRFWVRRVFRLFPAYWLVIAAAYGFLALGGPDALPVRRADTGTWLANLTMLQGFVRVPHVLGVFWTLQLELVIYAACSVLFAFRLMNRWTSLLVIYLIGYTVAGVAKPLLTGKPFGIAGNGFLYLTPLMGVAAQRYVAGEFGRLKTYGLLAGQVLSLVTVWTVNHLLNPAGMTRQCLDEFLFLWGFAYLILFGLVEARHLRMPAVLCWFGRISYSVYLFHPLVLVLLIGREWAPWRHVAVFAAVTLLAADLSYRLVERPGIAAGRWLEAKWFGPPPGRPGS